MDLGVAVASSYVPSVLLIAGLPASGKSTFVRHACDRRGAATHLLLKRHAASVIDAAEAATTEGARDEFARKVRDLQEKAKG